VKNLTTTAYNATPVGRGHDNASNNKIKGYFWTLRGFTRVVRSVLMSPTHLRVYRTRPNLFLITFFMYKMTQSNISWLDNNKKYLYDKTKKSLETSLNFLTFNDILVVSLWYIYIYVCVCVCVCVCGQIQNFVSSYMIIMKK